MRVTFIVPALTLVAALNPAHAQAQPQPASGVEARLTAGVGRQYGVFGDDSPKDSQGVAPSVGGHLLARRSPRFAWVLEGTLHPAGLKNPHFDESVSSLYVQFGPEFGRRVHVRPAVGMAVQSWSGSRSCQCMDLALAGGVAAGTAHLVGAGVRVTPELFARGAMAVGAFTSAVGVQVGVGWTRR
jgi:hypothetical protein